MNDDATREAQAETLALVILNSDRAMAGLPAVADRAIIPDSDGYFVNARAVLDRLASTASVDGGGDPVREAICILRCMTAHADEDADEIGQSRIATNAAEALSAKWGRVTDLWREMRFPGDPEHAGRMDDEMDRLLAGTPEPLRAPEDTAIKPDAGEDAGSGGEGVTGEVGFDPKYSSILAQFDDPNSDIPTAHEIMIYGHIRMEADEGDPHHLYDRAKAIGAAWKSNLTTPSPDTGKPDAGDGGVQRLREALEACVSELCEMYRATADTKADAAKRIEEEPCLCHARAALSGDRA